MKNGDIALHSIDETRAIVARLASEIWEHPEVAGQEYFASTHTAEILREAGFAVTLGTAGMDTAILATFGSGRPVIGFLGEYDALPGLSQKVATYKEPIVENGPGHGCGHNLLGAAHVAAVIGVKAEMTARNLPGTIVFYGCPAEETMRGKAMLARDGAFDRLDCFVNFHPGVVNGVINGTFKSMNSFKLHFKGRTAHAGGDPYNGRSALDAVELTNVGINYLREHVTSDVRMHYVITDGGLVPNIVPDKASAWYFVRADARETVRDVYARVLAIARGAAMMTGTEVEIEFLGGNYPTMHNATLSKVLTEALHEAPQEDWTEEELAFARALNEYNPNGLRYVNQLLSFPPDTQLHTGVCEDCSRGTYGSTDVGDVQHIVPGVMLQTACANLGVTGHSWQLVACSNSSIGEKGMHLAAKIMALFALRLLERPETVEAAKAEFLQEMHGETYQCTLDGMEE